MQDLKVTPIRFTQKLEAPKLPEAGSPPVVLVRTIEQTLKDQQWDKDERERKEWRKIEAFKATLGTAEGERYDSIIKNSRLPSALEASKQACEVIQGSREQRRESALAGPTVITFDEANGADQALTTIYRDGVLDIVDAEQTKYERMWAFDQYRAVAPGEGIAARFMDIAKPKAGSEVIDFGAGTGRGALMLAIMGMKVKMLDFATNCLDEDVRNALTTQAHVLSFHQQDLRQAIPYVAEFGYCTDVLEHIEPDQVPVVLSNILRSAQHVFFQISCVDDVCGALIGEPLHLSVHPYAWWHDLFTKLGCVFHWSKDEGDSCLFYVSGWIQGKDMVDVGVLNIGMEQVRANVEFNMGEHWYQADIMSAAWYFLSNVQYPEGSLRSAFEADGLPFNASIIESVKLGPHPESEDACDGELVITPPHEVKILYWRGNSNLYWAVGKEEWQDALDAVDARTFRWKQVSPHETNDTEVMILGNGPSLGRSLDEIYRLKEAGVKIITLNGAYQWCRQNFLMPVNQVVVDARPFNDRFTHPVEEGCKYFIASQCDQTVLEGLPKDRTWLWHTTAESIKDILDKHDEVSWGIPGGSTALLRAIPLFRMLGFAKFHLFGCDSCCDEDGTHHTTLQPENNNTPFQVIVGGRQFLCHPDQFSQAQEFIDLIKMMGNVIELEVHGDGLLAWILKTGASLADATATPTADEKFVL